MQSLKSSELTNRQLSSICDDYMHLTSIDLGGSRALTASSLRPLSRLSKLTALSLSGSNGFLGGSGKKSLAGLEGLVGLKRLDLSYMGLCASAMARVGTLQGLNTLILSTERDYWQLCETQLLPLQELTNLRSKMLTRV